LVAHSVKEAQAIAAQHPPVDCDSFLPSGVTVPRSALPTRISYRLALDGSLHDLTLYRSSGNIELDKAALACAGASHDFALDASGNPLEINWIGAISWNYFLHRLVEPDPSSDEQRVCHVEYPAAAIPLHAEGDSLVSYHIATDGSVKDATITASTGYWSLDKASLNCVAPWHFFPATHNGSPVQIERQSVFRWRM
jgi:TonB family protein